MMRDPAIVRELFARFGIDDRDLAPMDRHGIVTPMQEYLVEIAHHRDLREALMPVVLFTWSHRVVGLPKRDALREFGMRVGLARTNEMVPLLQRQRTKGLITLESIAQHGHAMGGDLCGMGAQPAFACRAFTVLCGVSVLRHDVLRG